MILAGGSSHVDVLTLHDQIVIPFLFGSMVKQRVLAQGGKENFERDDHGLENHPICICMAKWLQYRYWPTAVFLEERRF